MTSSFSGPLYWLFLGVIPWWFYVILSITAAIIIIVELPNRVGLVLGLMAALILGDIGFTAKGYQMGTAKEKAYWVAQAKLEHERLDAGFQAQLQAETLRADAAAQENATLRQEKQDAIDSVPGGAPGDAIVIPALAAAKLYLIGRATPTGGTVGGPPQHPSGPRQVPAMLLPSDYTPVPH